MSNWCRKLNRIFLTLDDVRVDLRLTINRSKPAIQASLKQDHAATNQSEKDKDDNSAALTDLQAETYSQSFGWQIEARGRLDNDTISLLNLNEGISAKSKRFETLKVFLTSISDSQKETSGGAIFYYDSTYEKTAEPCLCLNLQVPEVQLEKICDELLAGRIRTLRLAAEIDSFELEDDLLV